METTALSTPNGVMHPHWPKGIGFAEAQRRFQEQFGPPAKTAAAQNKSLAPRENSRGCLGCLHHQVRIAITAKNRMLVSLAEAKKFADELKTKQSGQSQDFERVVNSLAKIR